MACRGAGGGCGAHAIFASWRPDATDAVEGKVLARIDRL
jgi:hypothetical protein